MPSRRRRASSPRIQGIRPDRAQLRGHSVAAWMAGLVLVSAAASAGATVYEAPAAFVAEAFGGAAPDAKALWLTGDVRAEVTRILGHTPTARVRYWQRGTRTAWVLEDIGKSEPITAGVVVDKGAIENVRVLAYRESRGGEVRYPFFTRQFDDARLTGDAALDQHIDGITGATLSVHAMTRMARIALVLDAQVRKASALAHADGVGDRP